MSVITATEEYKSTVSPARMFKALVLDSHIIFPKLMPQSIKSIEFIKGDGGVGSITQTTFPDGSRVKFLKHKIDELDASKFHCKYTLIEGDILEKVVYEVKFEPSGIGSVYKTSSHYHTKPGVEIKEEEIKARKDKTTEMFKVVEEYLIANPDVCA